MKRCLSIGLIVFWGLMVVLLVRRTTSLPTPALLPVSPPPLVGANLSTHQETHEGWMGIYHQEKKIGYFHRRLIPTETGYRWEEQSRMKLSVLETPQLVQTEIRATMDRGFALQDLTFRLLSAGTVFQVSGTVTQEKDGQVFQGQITSGNNTSPFAFPLREPLYLPTTIPMALSGTSWQPGTEQRYTVFSPLSMRAETIVITSLGTETLQLKGQALTVSKIAERFSGTTVHAWIDHTGTVVKEEAALGLILLRESRAEAIGGGWQDSTPLDLVTSAAIVVAQSLPDPRAVTQIRLKVSGLHDPALFSFPPRQQYDNGWLTVSREDRTALSTYQLPQTHPEFAANLASTPFVQSAHPRLVAQAQRILHSERDAMQAVRLLLDWTFATLAKEPTVGMPTALEALESKKGDCNEHAVLFTALARAAGIPARVAAGVVYLDAAFYYHAWAEVWLGQWVAVDPVFHQFPADATHIKFIQGGPEEHMALLKVIGQLGLDVIAYQ